MKIINRFLLLLWTALLLISTGCETLGGLIRVDSDSSSKQSASVVFSQKDKQTIQHYYRGVGRKHKKYPPGMNKRLEKGKELPPGIAKQHLPGTLENQLTPLPQGYLRIKIGGDVMIQNTISNVVTDIMYGVD